MPGRNPEEAWREFREPIKRAVGCVDLTVRLRERPFDNGVRWLASPTDGISFGRLKLNFSLQLEDLHEPDYWRMTTIRYDYTVTDPGVLDPKTGTPTFVFGWHWHPRSKQSHITYPHVHVPSAASYRTRHIPTGRVALEDVLLFGIEDLGVPGAHASARSTLEAVRDKHKQHRSWG